jgi:hypothetical protein
MDYLLVFIFGIRRVVITVVNIEYYLLETPPSSVNFNGVRSTVCIKHDIKERFYSPDIACVNTDTLGVIE